MKIENLEITTYKNYKAVCEVLDEPVKTGKSKQLQLKKWEEHFTWINNGNKFVITDIKVVTFEEELSLINNNIIKDKKDNEVTTFSDNSNILHSRLQEEMELDIEESSLHTYEHIINQIEGNSLKQLIAKSIINQLYLQVSQVGQVGFKDCWWVTDAELYKATGMISDSHYYAIRNPKRFCSEMSELAEDNLDEVLDHVGVNRDWLNKQRSRVLKYLVDDLHLITHYQNAYFFIMKTTRIDENHTAYTREEYYYPTLDELEWINKDVIPKVMRQHKDKDGKEYTSLVKIKYDGKIQEFYQEWLPQYINSNLPTGWGIVAGVYKCHRIGFSQDVIESAVNSNMRLLSQEKEILDEIANSIVEITRNQITDNRNEQSKKRHEQAVNGKSKSDEKTREIRSRESYIGIGYVVNRELHSNEASYKDYTKYDSKNRTIVSKVVD